MKPLQLLAQFSATHLTQTGRRMTHAGVGLAGILLIGAASGGCGNLPAFDEEEGVGVEDGTKGSGGTTGGRGTITVVTGMGGETAMGPPDEEGGICGNGELESLELCDDGNTKGGDGCSKDCRSADEDFICITPGEACVRVSTCGNSIIEGSEACDDGDTDSDDGCSAGCDQVEDGYSCAKPGEACLLLPVCGNGLRERGESCDDAEAVPDDGDGCSATCQEEDANSWFCPAGEACVALDCGDGNRTPDEECDDGPSGASSNGDGCTTNCTVEPGWRCGGAGCRPICGDLIRVGTEECDDGADGFVAGAPKSGDGCSAACKEEPFYSCPSTGACSSTIVCGDGCVEPGEICDPGDGDLSRACGEQDADCVSVSEDPSRACKFFQDPADTSFCGDGDLNANEECDPDCGSAGCSIAGCTGCTIDDDYACPKPGVCFKIPLCGDGELQLGETCDPGPVSTAGCQIPACTVTPGYFCEVSSVTLVSECEHSVCGDGYKASDEQCDNGPGTVPGVPGTPAAGDGCDAMCQVEDDWVCPPGRACQPVCGNGVIQPGEQCDPTTPSAGCLNCFIQPGWKCTASSCSTTSCPSAGTAANLSAAILRAEYGEGCDDGNTVAGDGCSPTCQLEPAFTHNGDGIVGNSDDGTPVNTSPSCGDGFKAGGEGCDDGNRNAGDGCSATCAVEAPAWSCSEPAISPPASIDFRVTYRDFKHKSDAAGGGHPHFKTSDSDFTSSTDRGMTGRVCTTANQNTADVTQRCGKLDVGGKPWYVKGTTDSNSIKGYHDAFSLWYRDSNPTNIAGSNGTIGMMNMPGTITLTNIGAETYRFSKDSWFPLTGQLFGNTPGQTNNFNFTTELRYFFQYKGGESLTFAGDDDVWVYVNGRLAIDVGGIHCPHRARVVLGDEDGTCNVDQTAPPRINGTTSGCGTLEAGSGNELSPLAACGRSTSAPDEVNDPTDGRFGMTKGQVYEVVLFHAERNPGGSNFQLTLDGFLAPRSTCQTTCGDGHRGGTEICDGGPSAPASGYDVCLSNCTMNFCGDLTVQGSNETCDSATKVTYQQTPGGCGFDCQPAPYCGDGEIQAFAGEVCDDGPGGNDGSYGKCANDCKSFGPYCGDKFKNGPVGVEDCDANTKVAYQADGAGCGFDCKWAPSCGDGLRNGPETCEPPNSLGCNAVCLKVPACGDGTVDAGEACDDGKFNYDPDLVTPAPYARCTDECTKGPHCGDGNPDYLSGEECDDGLANTSTTMPVYDSCTRACLFGPFCGDGAKQGDEACDNGYNEDTYAYPGMNSPCGASCTAVPRCGDGIVQTAVEQCDNGGLNSDTLYDGCRTDCYWGPYCGDGVTSPGEQCDDPDGNVAYSADGEGCSYECTTDVPYCGDGVRNGPEQCDKGTAANDGTYGGCKTDCKLAPRCGDKVVQKDDGEQCDAGPSGSLSCSPLCTLRDVVK